jgi:enoyl-CoA hydratase/carnithine racemase
VSSSELVTRKSEEDGVELLVLRHPPVNALSTALLDALDRRVEEAADGARAIVLTGEGTYFSAGADLGELSGLDPDRAPDVLRRGLAVVDRLASAPAPTVAAVNGLAVGGGLELALACDLRIAGDSAKLGAPEVNFGLMPAYGGTQRLLRLVGPAKARELVFTGNLVPAAEAARIGLVNRTVPAGQELRAARDLAHTIATKAPKAVRAAKWALRAGADVSLAEGIRTESQAFLRDVLASEDLAEGLAAFAERRPPRFRGA